MGYDVSEAPLLRNECEKQMSEPLDLCLIDMDTADDVHWLFDLLERRQPNCCPILLAENIARHEVFELVLDKGVSHVIAKRPGPNDNIRVIDEQELIATCDKLASKDIFKLEKYLPRWHLDVGELRISSTEDRYRCVEELAAYLERLYCPERMISLICTATDELIMNAMFSAPTDSQGHHKYNEANRAKPLSLDSKEQIKLRYTCDGYNVLVSVEDNFGSLARSTLVEHLRNGWLGQQRAVRWDTGGAGLGLHLVFSSAAQFIANIEPGVRTELVTIYYVREGLRRLSEMGHSLNIFFRG